MLKVNYYFLNQLVNDQERRVWCEREWRLLTASQKKDCVQHAQMVIEKMQNEMFPDDAASSC